MAQKRFKPIARKRVKPTARWGVYVLMSVVLLAVFGAATQLLAAAPSPNSTPAASTASQAANVSGAGNAAGASSSVRTLYVYGDGMRPLVEETNRVQTLNIYGPGGQIIAQVVRDGLGEQEVRYLLADHLGSTRAVLDADGNVVARFEYGPHGETTAAGTAAAEVRYRYTGHPWDEAQGVYETPARGYDPTLGRFLSVDAARQSTSPYSYAGNNPVNKVDPNGLGPVHFFLYSAYGTMISDYRGEVSLRKPMHEQLQAIQASGLTVEIGQLEGPGTKEFGSTDQAQHLTIMIHGDPLEVSVYNLQTENWEGKNGEEFADYLYERLSEKYPESVKTLKSILFDSCGLACDRDESPSFADSFASNAKDLFPKLERVYASPYQTSTEYDPEDGQDMFIKVFQFDDDYLRRGLRYKINAGEYFSGNLEPHLLDPPNPVSVDAALTQLGRKRSSSGNSIPRYRETTDSVGIRDFIFDHGFNRAVFREIPIRPPAPVIEAPVD